MNPDEKLKALKKAYADIILNTAKEAAARIMASERKSARLQNELNSSKEQAVQMLLRLKHMSDSKTREAETNSLSKQKKLDELEAQLQEAEDIVKELRDELRLAHDELERVKKSHLIDKKPEAEEIVKQLRDELRRAYDELERVKKSHLIEKGPEAEEIVKQLRDELRCACDEIERAKKSHLIEKKPEAEEIVKQLRDELRAANHELERMRKSHLIEKKAEKVTSSATVLMEKSALDQINEAYNTFQDDNDNDNDGIQENISNLGNENRNNFFDITNSYVSNMKLPSIILGSYKNKRTQRIRAFEEKLMAGELAFSNTIHEEKNDEKVEKKSLKRKRNTKYKKNLIFSSGHEQDLDNEVEENPLDLLSRLSEDKHNKRTLKKCSKVSESGVFPETSCSADVDKSDVADCEPSKQPGAFKYTFQRKNKQGLGDSGTKNATVENEIVKDDDVAETEKGGDDVAEMEVSASVAESAGDSQVMAQVARQLIALSDKKW